MHKICPKCNYERSEKDFAPESECPKCGVIYEKTVMREMPTEQVVEHESQTMARPEKRFPVTTFLVAGVMIVGLCFFGYKSGLLDRLVFWGIDTGTIEDSVYKNEYFGFRITLPEGWSPIDPEAQEEIEKVAGQMIAANHKGLDAVIQASADDAVNMFTVFKHPLGSPVPFNPSVTCMAQKVSHFPGIKRGSDYLYHLKSAFDTLDLKPIHIEYSGSTSTEDLGGVDFDVLDIRVQFGRTQIIQKYYARIMKGYVLSYIMTYQSWSDMQELDSCLESVRFI